MLKTSYAGCPFRRSLLLKCVSQPAIAKKFTESPYFGSLRSFKVIDVDTSKSSSPVLVMISSMSVLICNDFHARRANGGK